MQLLVRLARERSGKSEGEPVEAAEVTQGEQGESLASQPEAIGSSATEPGAGGSGQSSGVAQIESLTPREVEVLRLLSQGQTNPQIAQNLLFSVSTVKAQVRSILAKLGVSDRTQAAVRAIEFRLTVSGFD